MDSPRSTPAFGLKPGWLAEDMKRASERVASGFATPLPGGVRKVLERIKNEMDDCGCGDVHAVRFGQDDLEAITAFLEANQD